MACKEKHNFAFGELTDEEKKRGCVNAIICTACEFRVVTTNKLSETDRVWATEVVARWKLTELISDMDIPITRRSDIDWLSRNLAIKNSGHKQLPEALAQIKLLLKLTR